MKFYCTIEPYHKLRHVFSNLSAFYIIDVINLVKESGLNPDKPSHRYIINTEIARLITNATKSKRYIGILYINPELNCNIISGIKTSIKNISSSKIEELILLDDYDTPKLKDYYKLFDEIIFFPTFKKMRIIECKPYNLNTNKSNKEK